jgi:Cu2+-containing amine oxidase
LPRWARVSPGRAEPPSIRRQFRTACFSVGLLVASHTSAIAGATHPLDALDAEEIRAAVRVLREAGRFDEATLFSAIKLAPPNKAKVYAAGRFPNQSTPGQGLPHWTQQNSDVLNQDLVVWYTLGFHHVPSSEDWPVYKTGSHGVTLRPYNFFDRSPAIDVPPRP